MLLIDPGFVVETEVDGVVGFGFIKLKCLYLKLIELIEMEIESIYFSTQTCIGTLQ